MSLFMQQEKSDQVLGRDKELAFLRNFITHFKTAKKKAVLLAGPAGVGKTSTVVFLAREFDYELVEVNASDTRNAEAIEARILPAATQMSFFSPGKIILIDEADGISGNADRGGANALVSVIEKTKFPIILTANDIEQDKLKSLLKVCELITLEPLSSSVIVEILEKKAKGEVSAKLIKQIAINAEGDIRGALNDLQILASGGDDTLLVSRQKAIGIEYALRTIFKTMDPKMAMQALDNIEETTDEQFFWIDYNVAREYTDPMDLARAYGYLTRADVFNRRIRKNQEWRLMVYVNALLSAGICLAKDAPYKTMIDYKRSTRALQIWQINMQTSKRKMIAQKIAAATHCSAKRAYHEVDYFKVTCKNNKEFLGAVTKQMDLSEEEVAFLTA